MSWGKPGHAKEMTLSRLEAGLILSSIGMKVDEVNISQGGEKSNLEAVLGSGMCPTGLYNTERSVLEHSKAGSAAEGSVEVIRNHNSPQKPSQGKKVRLSTSQELSVYGISGYEILRSGVPALSSDQDAGLGGVE